MATRFETQRVKEALELQITAIQRLACRLAAQDVDQLDGDLVELERSVADLRGLIEGLPHHHRVPEPRVSPPASPATNRPERLAKGSETADGTQRQGE